MIVHIMLLLNLFHSCEPLFTSCVPLEAKQYNANMKGHITLPNVAESNVPHLIIRFSEQHVNFDSILNRGQALIPIIPKCSKKNLKSLRSWSPMR